MPLSGVEEIRAQAREVAAGWSPPDAPESWRLTAALFEVIGGHEELLAALSGLPPGRLPALLASAAISFLVRRDRPAGLAGYFPDPGGAQPPFDDGFGPAARAFMTERVADIMAECRSRRYQMNEVARCTHVALGIAATAGRSAGPAGSVGGAARSIGGPAGRAGGPVALVDLGTGAGLGLRLDEYRYVVGDQPPAGPEGARLSLTCDWRGPRQPPRACLPPIGIRVGIEISPVDLDDPAARAWLTACAPPEASALSRLTAAIEVCRSHPARIITGDVAEALPGVLAGLPQDCPVVVTEAYLAVFLPPEQRAQLTTAMASAARNRPVTWLSLDPLVPLGPAGRDSVQGIPLPDSLVADYQRNGVFAVLGARTFDGSGGGGGRLLARGHPSGRWIEWLEA